MFDDKDPSSDMQRNILLAFALSALVLVLFSPKPQPKKPATVAPPQTSNAPVNGTDGKNATNAPATTTAAPAKAAEVVPAIPVMQGITETDTPVESDLYEIHFSNRGAVAASWVLKGFKDSDDKQLDLVNPVAVAQVGWPLLLRTDDVDANNTLNNALFAVKSTGRNAPTIVTFEWSNGSLAARKEFTFEAGSYIVRITTEVTRDGKPVAHEAAWRGGFGDRTLENYNTTEISTVALGDKLEHKTLKDVKTDEQREAGPFSYVTLEDKFFCAVFMPGGESAGPAVIPQASVFKNSYAAGVGKTLDLLGVAAGGDGVNHFRAYIGPKDLALLRTISPEPGGDARLRRGEQVVTLAPMVDYGWFSFVALPMYLCLKWISAHVVSNYGWSIVLLTVVINFALLPLKMSSMKSSQKMQKLAPQVKAIQDRYKKYKMSDPKKQEANEEVMALYKKEGVNPLGGCLPLVIQIPFFYGFYRMIAQAIEMRHASWLWVPDLSAHEAGWFHVLPILMIVTMLLLQKMTPQPAGDPAQQKMLMMMPLVFGIGFYNVSSGLVLYWLTGNLVQMAQQWFFNRTSTTPVAVSSGSIRVRKELPE
jgi:YidC/Oxa1 family membrane protein insertase